MRGEMVERSVTLGFLVGHKEQSSEELMVWMWLCRLYQEETRLCSCVLEVMCPKTNHRLLVRNVLVKGGDLPDSLDAVDIFFDGEFKF